MSEGAGEGPAEEGLEAGDGGPAKAEPSLEGLSVRPSKHRRMQLRQDGKRKLFKGKARKVFLEWLAATGNVVLSAAKAGFAYQTVWKHRLKDDDFAGEMDRALDQGVVRATARLVEDKVKGRIEIDGEIDPADIEPADPQIVLNIIGVRERARQGHPRLQRTTARIATNKEVEKALRKRLATFARREKAMKRGKGASQREDSGSGLEILDGGAVTPPPPCGRPAPPAPGSAPSGSPPDCRAAPPPSPSGDGEAQE